jgi:adenine-specific DNA methylase
VQEDLTPYDHEAISEVIPTYFSEIRPNLDKASHEIAKLRRNKDAEANDILIHVEKYNSVLTALIKDVEKIRNGVGALADYKKRKGISKFKEYLLTFVLGAVIAAILIACADHIKEVIWPPNSTIEP